MAVEPIAFAALDSLDSRSCCHAEQKVETAAVSEPLPPSELDEESAGAAPACYDTSNTEAQHVAEVTTQRDRMNSNIHDHRYDSMSMDRGPSADEECIVLPLGTQLDSVRMSSTESFELQADSKTKLTAAQLDRIQHNKNLAKSRRAAAAAKHRQASHAMPSSSETVGILTEEQLATIARNRREALRKRSVTLMGKTNGDASGGYVTTSPSPCTDVTVCRARDVFERRLGRSRVAVHHLSVDAVTRVEKKYLSACRDLVQFDIGHVHQTREADILRTQLLSLQEDLESVEDDERSFVTQLIDKQKHRLCQLKAADRSSSSDNISRDSLMQGLTRATGDVVNLGGELWLQALAYVGKSVHSIMDLGDASYLNQYCETLSGMQAHTIALNKSIALERRRQRSESTAPSTQSKRAKDGRVHAPLYDIINNCKGIPNEGNTCFVGAVLQMLLRVHPFYEALEVHQCGSNCGSDVCVLRSVYNHGKAIRGGTVVASDVSVPFLTRRGICGVAFSSLGFNRSNYVQRSKYKRGIYMAPAADVVSCCAPQCDAMEFLVAFLQLMSETLPAVCDIFYNRISHHYRCVVCGHTWNEEWSALAHELMLPSCADVVDLPDVWSAYVKGDDFYTRSRCHCHGRLIRGCSTPKEPLVVIVNIHRPTDVSHNIRRVAVKLPEYFKPFAETTYRLVALLLRHGHTHVCGHYTSLCLSDWADGSFSYCNDSRVTRVPNEVVFHTDSYEQDVVSVVFVRVAMP